MRKPEPIPDDVQGISSGDTRAIITKVHCIKTARGHAGTEASSGPAPYPYRGLLKKPIPCNLGLPLEL